MQSAFFIAHACKAVNPHRGVLSTFNNANLYLPDSYAHAGYVAKHVIHTATGSPCGSGWVEQGLMRGAETGVTGVNEYFWFTASKSIQFGGSYSARKLGNETVSHFTTHRYELYYYGLTGQPPNIWGAYLVRRDGRDIVGSGGQGDGSCVSSVGIASNLPPNSLWWTGEFNATSTYWMDSPNANLQGDFGYLQWIDYPCGQGQNPPNCFNGGYRSIDWWDSNKP